MIRKIQANKPENEAYAIPNLTYKKNAQNSWHAKEKCQ